jgi:hypothetical protein
MGKYRDFGISLDRTNMQLKTFCKTYRGPIVAFSQFFASSKIVYSLQFLISNHKHPSVFPIDFQFS